MRRVSDPARSGFPANSISDFRDSRPVASAASPCEREKVSIFEESPLPPSFAIPESRLPITIERDTRLRVDHALFTRYRSVIVSVIANVLRLSIRTVMDRVIDDARFAWPILILHVAFLHARLENHPWRASLFPSSDIYLPLVIKRRVPR